MDNVNRAAQTERAAGEKSMSKATHKGHCQVCGGLQMLPSGTLSLHGYKVEYGFFNGICHGAKAKPFEQAHDLVDAAIVRAEQALRNIVARQIALRSPAMDPIAIVNVFVKDARGKTYHEWRKVEVKVRFSESGYATFYHETFVDQPRFGSRDSELSANDFSEKDTRAVATKYNRTFADWLEYEAKSLRRYIAWQTERVRTWTKQPLIAVDAKDKAAFKPEQPLYEVKMTEAVA
jgi:hypothetical protein